MAGRERQTGKLAPNRVTPDADDFSSQKDRLGSMDEDEGVPRPKFDLSSTKKQAADSATIGARARPRPRPPAHPSTDATIVSIDLAPSSASASPPPFQPVIVHDGLLRKPSAPQAQPQPQASGLGLGLGLRQPTAQQVNDDSSVLGSGLGLSSGQSPAAAPDRGRDGSGSAVDDDPGLPTTVESLAGDDRRRSTRSSVRAPHGLLKKFSPEAIDAAVRSKPLPPSPSPSPSPSDSLPELELSSAKDSSPLSPAMAARRKIRGPGPKPGGVLDMDEPKGVRICVLGVGGRVLYLEAYKDFVDLLLNFLTMRTGALIKLLRQVDLPSDEELGMLKVYDSLSKLDRALLTVDKDVLLDPVQKLNLAKELRALDSFEAECCNAECPKYMAGSRLVCRGCTLSSHFSCSICNAYFRDNVHATTCYAPWRPWSSHASAAPVLNRYTVVQSMGAVPPPPAASAAAASPRPRAARDGFVKNGVPFMITNELTLTPLTTRSIAKFLKTLNDLDGETESLDCHELMIGKTEVVLLLGAAMTSLTPLTDVFAKLCHSENKISGSSTFSSEGLPSLSGGQFAARSDTTTKLAPKSGPRLASMAKPLGDLMTFVRPLASGFADALQQGTSAALHGLSAEAQHREAAAAAALESLNAVEDKSLAAAIRKKTIAPSSSAPVATTSTQAVNPEMPAAAEDSNPAAAAANERTRESTGSRTGLSVGHRQIQGPAAAFAPLEPVQNTLPQRQQKDLLPLPAAAAAAADDQPAQLTIRRRSSGIVAPQSIFLQPSASEGPPSPASSSPSGSSTPRRGFLKKFFRSKVVQSPKIPSPPSPPVTPPVLVTSAPTAVAADGSISPDHEGIELPPAASDDPKPSVADDDQQQPSPPPSPSPSPSSTPAPKKRRGWFKGIELPPAASDHPKPSAEDDDQPQPSPPPPSPSPSSTPGPKKRRGWFKYLAPYSAAPLSKPSQLRTTKLPDPPQSPLPASAAPLSKPSQLRTTKLPDPPQSPLPASADTLAMEDEEDSSVTSRKFDSVESAHGPAKDDGHDEQENSAESTELKSDFEQKFANRKSPPSDDFSFEHSGFQ